MASQHAHRVFAADGPDADLYRAWVPERIRRDFHGASIRRKDLAL